MLGNILLFGGSAAIFFWGAMHIAKTRAVVAGFEPLSLDNRRVLTMEWIGEGVTLCFIATLVTIATLIHGAGEPVVALVCRSAAVALVVMAAVSLFTGARASPVPYKLCPAIFTSVAVLYVLGTLV